MAEGTHIPGTPACGEWETLLADALDGLLKPEEEARFLAHKAGCPACAALYEAARKGREWLEFLSPEPEPPEGLLERILATTGPGHAVSGLPVPAAAGGVPAFVPPVWQQPGFHGADAFQRAAAAADDGGDGVLFHRAHAEPGGRAVVESAACRLEAACGAVVHGTAIDHGFSADRALLRPSAVCVRGGSAHARAARPARERRQRRRPATEANPTGNAGRDAAESGDGIPASHDGGLRAGPRRTAGHAETEPASSNEYLETSLTFPMRSKRKWAHQSAVQRLQWCKRWKGAHHGLRKP